MTALVSEAAGNAFVFGRYCLVPEQQLLLEDGRAVRIGKRAFDLLTVLVRSHGQVVGKQDLIAQVWPGLDVEEGNLKVNVGMLRRILGEGAGPPRYIATVVGRGYRFVAPVHALATSARSDPATPLLTKRIFGRDEVIAAILHDLRDARLVSIVGPGGAGKTTVALAVADGALDAFEAGIQLVDLAPVSAPSKVGELFAEVIRTRIDLERAAPRSKEDSRDRELLLVVDNCEHLIDEVATCIDQVLARTRNVRVIATSREPLCIRGERVRRLSGLALPPAAAGLKAEDARRFPAVQLFVERAVEKSKTFALDDDNAPTVAAICQRLGGLALAIERVAQRAGSRGTAGMLDHLERRFHMFDGYHEGPVRHRTLTATVDASYVLLSASEQTALRWLSVFVGAFSLDAACAIVVRSDFDRAAVIRDTASLVAKSLLSTEARSSEMLYRLGHVTRAFAIEKLIAHEELVPARERHAAYLLACLDESEPSPRSGVCARLAAFDDELREALRWVLEGEPQSELARRLAAAHTQTAREPSNAAPGRSR